MGHWEAGACARVGRSTEERALPWVEGVPGRISVRKASEDALVGFEDEKELACLKGKLGGRE